MTLAVTGHGIDADGSSSVQRRREVTLVGAQLPVHLDAGAHERVRDRRAVVRRVVDVVQVVAITPVVRVAEPGVLEAGIGIVNADGGRCRADYEDGGRRR